jgi:regulator of protease activity HflC (stomatin/prohibitin superfamily)
MSNQQNFTMQPPSNQQVDLPILLKKAFKGSIGWILLAFILILIFVLSSFRLGRVSGEQVGVLLNKRTGKMTVLNTGVTIYNGITNSFYVMDKTLQTLDMTASTPGTPNCELKIKTIDGSDVYVPLIVQFKIEQDQVIDVINTSGPGDEYKHKWARDYVRSICRNHLGELSTEEFYDSGKRQGKIAKAKAVINSKLTKKFGISIDSIIPQKPRFYKEYEEMIKKKKLADQAVLEEQSKANAAKQRQHTEVVQTTNKKNVAVEQYEGKMSEKVIASEAQGEKVRKAAEAYFDRITIGADARLYESQKKAEAILAAKMAEAEGIEAMKKALEGEGGVNMVKLEYAKKLKDVKFSGRPYAIDPGVSKFEHTRLQQPAAIAK